jgi:CheY-like chemotaxis protein
MTVGRDRLGASEGDGLVPEGDTADQSATKLRAGTSVKPARAGRVLVVDDEAAVGRTIQRLLAERHDVVVLTSGQDAIAMLAGGAEFDVVLCDISMPEVTGIDVYQRVMAARPEMGERFVFMTGGTFTARMREFFETSTHERIDKPFDLDVLRAIVGDKVSLLAR